jgi:hypothetical protein
MFFAVITVTSLKDQGNDNGKNPFVLKLNSDETYFNDIENLQFFEFDLDKNDINEIYVINYASCKGY